MDSFASIVRSNPEIEISTDASTKGVHQKMEAILEESLIRKRKTSILMF